MSASSFSRGAIDVSPLAHLIERAREVTGFLDGQPGDALPGWYRTGSDNADVLHGLVDALAATYAHAGQPLWAVRMCTNLLWQPAYLMVVAAHFTAGVPSLSTLSQRHEGPDVVAYRYGDAPPVPGDLEERIDQAAVQLQPWRQPFQAAANPA